VDSGRAARAERFSHGTMRLSAPRGGREQPIWGQDRAEPSVIGRVAHAVVRGVWVDPRCQFRSYYCDGCAAGVAVAWALPDASTRKAILGVPRGGCARGWQGGTATGQRRCYIPDEPSHAPPAGNGNARVRSDGRI